MQWSAWRPLWRGSVTAHSQFIDRRITVDAPSLSATAVRAAATAPAAHASYSTVFLSIDKHRHTEMQRQREEDAEYKRTDNEAVGLLCEGVGVRLTEQTHFTHRFFITFPTGNDAAVKSTMSTGCSTDARSMKIRRSSCLATQWGDTNSHTSVLLKIYTQNRD